jgi:hypothetical protein
VVHCKVNDKGAQVQLWNRIVLDDVPWQEVPGYPEVSMRLLSDDLETGPPAVQFRFSPNYIEQPHWHASDTLYVITAGEFVVENEGTYRPGDVRWVRAGTFYGPETAGPAGCEFILAALGQGPLGLNYDESTAAHHVSHQE